MAQTEVLVLQNAATVNGNGTPIDGTGYTNAQQMEIQETAGGTATVTFEGSFDGTTWYSIGYYTVDAQATLTRAVTGVSVLANSKHVYQLLDPYPEIRARVSAVAAGGTVTVKGYMV